MPVTDSIASLVLSLTLLKQQKSPSDNVIYSSSPDFCPKLVHRGDLPPCAPNNIRVVAVSDTHKMHAKLQLPQCDIFVHCGDILMTNRLFSKKKSIQKLKSFNHWLGTIPSTQKIVIGGNHDNVMENLGQSVVKDILHHANYLENEIIQIGNLTFWASPFSEGISKNKAFQSEKFRKECLEKAPSKVDILLSHGQCPMLESKIEHKVHIWGHSHNSYGIKYPGDIVLDQEVVSISMCTSTMDADFDLCHPPMVIDVPNDMSDMKIPHSSQVTLQGIRHLGESSGKIKRANSSDLLGINSIDKMFAPSVKVKIVPI